MDVGKIKTGLGRLVSYLPFIPNMSVQVPQVFISGHAWKVRRGECSCLFQRPVYFDVVLPPAYIKSGNALFFFHLMPLSLPVKKKKTK